MRNLNSYIYFFQYNFNYTPKLRLIYNTVHAKFIITRQEKNLAQVCDLSWRLDQHIYLQGNLKECVIKKLKQANNNTYAKKGKKKKELPPRMSI